MSRLLSLQCAMFLRVRLTLRTEPYCRRRRLGREGEVQSYLHAGLLACSLSLLCSLPISFLPGRSQLECEHPSICSHGTRGWAVPSLTSPLPSCPELQHYLSNPARAMPSASRGGGCRFVSHTVWLCSIEWLHSPYISPSSLHWKITQKVAITVQEMQRYVFCGMDSISQLWRKQDLRNEVASQFLTLFIQ